MDWKHYKIIYLIKRIIRFFIWKILYKYRIKQHQYNFTNKIELIGNLSSDLIKKELRGLELEILPLSLDQREFFQYYKLAKYSSFLYRMVYKGYITDKIIEHFLSFKLLDFNKDDIFIDVGSGFSEFPCIVRRLIGCKVYRQDLDYPEGLGGDIIGGSASQIPLPDNAVTKISLCNTFEHFEGNADVDFIYEVNRLLKSAGRVCIVPLNLALYYYNQVDFTMAKKNSIIIDEKTKIIYTPGHGSRFERWYDIASLKNRIINKAKGLKIKIYIFKPSDYGSSVRSYKFALLLEK